MELLLRAHPGGGSRSGSGRQRGEGGDDIDDGFGRRGHQLLREKGFRGVLCEGSFERGVEFVYIRDTLLVQLFERALMERGHDLSDVDRGGYGGAAKHDQEEKNAFAPFSY